MTFIRTRARNAVWHLQRREERGQPWCYRQGREPIQRVAQMICLAEMPDGPELVGVPICGRCLVVWRIQG